MMMMEEGAVKREDGQARSRSGRAGDMGTRAELTVPGGWRSDDEIR